MGQGLGRLISRLQADPSLEWTVEIGLNAQGWKFSKKRADTSAVAVDLEFNKNSGILRD